MVIFQLIMLYTNQPGDSFVQYIAYAIYAGGIAWTLLAYSRSPEYTGKFGDVFGQGFRCFIVVVLILVIFTAIYTISHPELAEEAAKNYRADLEKAKDKMPAQIDEMVSTAKKQFLTGNIMMAIFGTLIPGAIFTLAGSALVLLRRK